MKGFFETKEFARIIDKYREDTENRIINNMIEHMKKIHEDTALNPSEIIEWIELWRNID